MQRRQTEKLVIRGKRQDLEPRQESSALSCVSLFRSVYTHTTHSFPAMPRESSIVTFTLPHLLWAVLPALSLQAVVGGQLQSICASAPDLQVLDQSIAHFDCSVNETVHALNCSHRGIPALPSTADTAVPVGVEIFDFSHNRIKCLPKINNTRPTCSIADCHVGCLLELRLQHNEIEYLHEEVFLDLTCLRSLDLSHNAITNQTLKRNHFFRLSSLQHLDLHGNPLHTLPDNVLISVHLSHLHTLNLSSCQLQEIGQVAIDDFFEMEVLDLSRNQLSWLSSRTFQGLTSLRILDLRWNMLEVIENDTFADLRNLQELRLDHNRLVSIGELAFHRHAALQTVGVLDNMLTAVPYRALATLKTLRRLDLSHNPIQVLEPSHTSTSVQELRLDHLTALTRVKDDAFSAFPLLTTLSLRFTGHLYTLPPNAFRGSTQHLREVELDHGALQFLPQELLPWGQLRLVSLHGNDWHCDCRMAWASGHTPGNATISAVCVVLPAVQCCLCCRVACSAVLSVSCCLQCSVVCVVLPAVLSVSCCLQCSAVCVVVLPAVLSVSCCLQCCLCRVACSAVLSVSCCLQCCLCRVACSAVCVVLPAVQCCLCRVACSAVCVVLPAVLSVSCCLQCSAVCVVLPAVLSVSCCLQCSAVCVGLPAVLSVLSCCLQCCLCCRVACSAVLSVMCRLQCCRVACSVVVLPAVLSCCLQCSAVCDVLPAVLCCQPVQLRGQTLADLKASDLSCPVSTLGVQVVIALSLTALFLAALGLVLSRKRRGVGCWCLRGDRVGYVTVFTRDTAGREDDKEEVANGTCGEGEVDDLDLGSGEGVGREEGRVRILVKSFRKGYSLLKNQGGESSQNLTSACDV
ncbi:hypothetical protein ACOMHN_046097 [Nucella lapillus]